jgi:type IV secretion system protein TrbI
VSEQIIESPDMLESSDKGNGIRRANKLPIWIIGILVIAVLMSVVYTGELRNAVKKAQAASLDQDKYRVAGVVPPPIAKPAGPDVIIPPTPPHPVYVQGQAMAPAQDPDWLKQQREAQAQAYRAALTADTEVNLSNSPSRQNAQQAQIPMPMVNGTIPPPPPQYGMEGGPPPDPAEQAQQRAFLAAMDPNASPYLRHEKHQAISPFEIKAGTVIPALTISGANSELPGLVTGQVKQDVYDSATGQHLLIPAGSRTVGTYDSAINSGQSRIFVAWQRIIFPDGSSITLDSMPGADQSGVAGFKDQVNNHYVRTFGQAFLLSLFSAGIQLSQPRGAVSGTYNAQQIGAAAIGQQLGMLGMQIARKNLNMAPTLEIRPGFEFTIVVNKDMIIPPWTGHPMAAAHNN